MDWRISRLHTIKDKLFLITDTGDVIQSHPRSLTGPGAKSPLLSGDSEGGPMKSKLCWALLLLYMSVVAAPAGAQAPLGYVSVPLDGQQTDVWCWAASGEMAMQYFGVSVQQCAEATFQFGQSQGKDCCTQPTPGVCISGGQVVIDHYGFTYQQLGGTSALTSTQIENQIATRNEPWIFNPYCANQSECGQWGHVLVGVGYFSPFFPFPVDLPFFFLIVNDPWPPTTGSSYLEFYQDYQAGCWWGNGSCQGDAEGWDIYDIVPPPPAHPLPFHHPEITWLSLSPDELRHVMQGDAEPMHEAAMAWPILRSALKGESAPRLGFESVSSTSEAKLKSPVEQFDVSLLRLRSWNREGSASDLLQRMPVLFVPVELDGHMRANIRLRQEKGLWRISSFGSPQFTQAWEKAQASGGEFLVMVEGLELAFAGKRVGNSVRLISLFTDPRFRLEAGQERPAEEVLAGLVGAANSYNGNGATTKLLEPGR